jgi:hypothetical protein
MLGLLIPSSFELFGMAVPPTLFFFSGMMGFVFALDIQGEKQESLRESAYRTIRYHVF